MQRKLSVLACVIACMAIAGMLKAKETAGKRSGAFGVINSIAPCGVVSGAGKPITFTAKVTFAGEGIGSSAKLHQIALRLVVLSEGGSVVCSHLQEWDVPDGEHGCILCPVSCTNAGLDPGVYFMIATMSDTDSTGKKTTLDAKSCPVILGQ